jgi:hypothetical protein
MSILSRLEKLEGASVSAPAPPDSEYAQRWRAAYRAITETMSLEHFVSVNAELAAWYSRPAPRGVPEYVLSQLAWLVNHLCGACAQGLSAPLMLPAELASLWLDYEREHIPASPVNLRHGLYRSFNDCSDCGALHPQKSPGVCVVCGGTVGFNYHERSYEHIQQSSAA